MAVIFRIITFSTFWAYSLWKSFTHARGAFSLGCRWTISFPHAHASDIPPPRALGFFLAVHTHTCTRSHTYASMQTHSLSLFRLSLAFTQTLIYSLLHTNIAYISLSHSHSTIRTSALFLLDHLRHIPSHSLSHFLSLFCGNSTKSSLSLSASQQLSLAGITPTSSAINTIRILLSQPNLQRTMKIKMDSFAEIHSFKTFWASSSTFICDLLS